MVIPTFSISGSAFDIGYQIGQHSVPIMKSYMIQSPTWQELIKWQKSSRLTEMQSIVQQKLPVFYREIEGIAAGVGLDVKEIFLWNCRGDLLEDLAEGCTTIAVPGLNSILIGHNEDGDPLFRNHVFIADITPEKGTGFTSFVYPCSIPGHTFALTHSGLIQTVNNLRPKFKGSGLPRQFLARAILDAKDLDDAVDMFNRFDRSGGFHYLLAQAGDDRIFSIESISERLSLEMVTEPFGHANHLIHQQMSHTPQFTTGSSHSRQVRIDEICRESTKSLAQDDVCRALWDQKNRGLPIYRDDRLDPDNENTLATAVFEIGNQEVDFSVYSSKNQSAQLRRTLRRQKDGNSL